MFTENSSKRKKKRLMTERNLKIIQKAAGRLAFSLNYLKEAESLIQNVSINKGLLDEAELELTVSAIEYIQETANKFTDIYKTLNVLERIAKQDPAIN